ncbi:hypothetical protein FIBSPDRAFT_872630 [Athelia psychrophila]|uniref:Uncharacterized protein n=1 Tax=Athelia psychrophila TaxID=1759441 RepID=A0A165ZC36_9AGAM|nr:hypothetical protein FIBSPDRAFT_872630 [Fibularhizoctonia sp. CBS 109695]
MPSPPAGYQRYEHCIAAGRERLPGPTFTVRMHLTTPAVSPAELLYGHKWLDTFRKAAW